MLFWVLEWVGINRWLRATEKSKGYIQKWKNNGNYILGSTCTLNSVLFWYHCNHWPYQFVHWFFLDIGFNDFKEQHLSYEMLVGFFLLLFFWLRFFSQFYYRCLFPKLKEHFFKWTCFQRNCNLQSLTNVTAVSLNWRLVGVAIART